MHSLRLGTRASLLASAQSHLISQQLQALHPGLNVELITVSTAGDRDRQTPLEGIRDPDFFSGDLDQALLAGTVDFCVHSLKDLPVQRPAGIRLAALPKREDPRDLIVWRHDVRARLTAGHILRLGSSSARRQHNVREFLESGLPASGRPPKLEFVPVRGPVDARLALLALNRSDPAALDGVVLALAGLTRLWSDPSARTGVASLLAPPAGAVRWMVLPLTRCPAAPGQGALALECRADDKSTYELLRTLHDPATEELLDFEKASLANIASADRPSFGATAIRHEVLGPVCHVRGRSANGVVERLVWRQPPAAHSAVGFDGIVWQRACTRRSAGPLPALEELEAGSAAFISYWHALEYHAVPEHVRLWTSGVESWRRLAARGHWVEGCGDNLGFATLRATLESPVLGLPPLAKWVALTYSWAAPGWRDSGVGSVFSTYDILPPLDDDILERLRESARQATHFYWSSAQQFHAFRNDVSPDATHACGAGKTWRALREAGVTPLPFPNGREWRQWLNP